MTLRRLFSHALIAGAAAVCTAVPATAAAATGWSAPETVSAAGQSPALMDNPSVNHRVTTAPDGTVSVAWVADMNGHKVLVSRQRSATTHAWGPTKPVSPLNADVYIFDFVTDDAGNSTAIWTDNSLAEIFSATLLSGADQWSGPDSLAPGGEQIYGVAIAPGVNGTATVAWSSHTGGENKVKLRTRDSNATTWGGTTAIDQASDAYTGGVALGFNADGDGVLVWTADVPVGADIRAARYDAQTDTWGAAETLANYTGLTSMMDVTVAPNGDAAAVWADDNLSVHGARLKNGSWGAADDLSGPGDVAVLPQLAADPDGGFVAVWQHMYGGADAAVESSTSLPAATGWSARTELPDGHPAAGPTLAVNSGGEMVVIYLAGDLSDFTNIRVSTTRRDGSTGDWEPRTTLTGSRLDAASGMGLPRAAIDEDGNVIAFWPQSDGTNVTMATAFFDDAGPTLSATTVPATGTAGVPVTVSTNASDLFSDVSGTTWDFGDGGSATGATATHTFAAAGTYTVTVSATDTAGNTSTTSATIKIAPAPVPAPPVAKPDPQPPVLAPVIEARLSGRTITLNAKVTLKKGRKCTGTVAATTRFGTTTYRSMVRLKTADGACRATGSIKLRKTPSARTKLTIKLTGSGTTTRAVTTKRA